MHIILSKILYWKHCPSFTRVGILKLIKMETHIVGKRWTFVGGRYSKRMIKESIGVSH